MKILNFGSLNLDYTYCIPHIVMPGETITSKGLQVYPGGKGLNQSVALAKAGANVYHAGLIGADGGMLRKVCKESGVDVTYLRECTTRSGNAIIQVDEHGQNSIILYPGANRQITKAFADEVIGVFDKGDVLLLQNEINELPYIIERAFERGMRIVLNPSPFDENLQECDLKKVSMFLLNEVESFQMTREKDVGQMLGRLRELYPEAEIVLTLGKKGSVYTKGTEIISQGIYPVQTVDTTGAGDTFTGYFVAEYFESGNPKKALKLASMAASMAVAGKGAASAVPWKTEVLTSLKNIVS